MNDVLSDRSLRLRHSHSQKRTHCWPHSLPSPWLLKYLRLKPEINNIFNVLIECLNAIHVMRSSAINNTTELNVMTKDGVFGPLVGQELFPHSHVTERGRAIEGWLQESTLLTISMYGNPMSKAIKSLFNTFVLTALDLHIPWDFIIQFHSTNSSVVSFGVNAGDQQIYVCFSMINEFQSSGVGLETNWKLFYFLSVFRM